MAPRPCRPRGALRAGSRRLAFVSAVVALTCGRALAHPAPRADDPVAGDLRLEPLALPGVEEGGAQRGRFFVPENRADEATRAIELAFVLLKGRGPAGAPPLVHLHGGPGGAATPIARDPEQLAPWLRLRAHGDVILLDQRGCGSSRPVLSRALQRPPPADLFLSRERFEAFLRDASHEVKRQLDAEGVDLDGYTTEESADDLEDLRAALGVPRLNLLGFSFGTHLAIAALRRHERSLHRVALIGVEGPNHTMKLPATADTAFRKLARTVAADPELGKALPDLVATLRTVLATAERTPFRVRVRRSGEPRPIELPIGPFGLQLLLFADLGDVSDLVAFPRLLADLARGDTTLLAWFAEKRYRQFANFPTLLFTQDPASGASRGRQVEIADQARASLFGGVADLGGGGLGDLWGHPLLGDDFRAPLVADVPTLFLSGTRDQNTPPWQAEEVRFGLRDSTHLILEDAGHETWMALPDAWRVLERFFAGEDVAGARIEVPPLRFAPLSGHDPARSHPAIPRG